MKKTAFYLSSIVLSLSFTTIAQARPMFKHYPVKVYKGKTTPPELNEYEMFRAGIEEIEENYQYESIDFAGKYAVFGGGCGAGCAYTNFFNVKTGKKMDFGIKLDPHTFCLQNGKKAEGDMAYRANSRLLVVKGIPNNLSTGYSEARYKCQVHYYLENNGRLKHIK